MIYVGDYRTAPTWAYTIGFRANLGAPEIMVFDLPRGLAQVIGTTTAPAGDFEAYQLVLSDPDGHLPWEAGYDERLRPRQPELYLPAGALPVGAERLADHGVV